MSGPMNLRGLDHVVFRVADMDRALAFWCGIMGCVEERRVPAIGLVQLRAGAALIDLVPAGGATPADHPAGRNVDHVALRLETFDEAALRRHFAGHGIEVGETARRYGAEGHGPSIYLADPDGNTIELKGPPDADQSDGPH